MSLTSDNIEYIFNYIEQLCGIALDQSKSYLIDARLNRLMKQYSVSNPMDLITRAKTACGEPIRQSLIEAMTTRETFFFRDSSPFEALQFKAIPELLDVKMRHRSNILRIWSAAASTGQEACSISMILHEMIPDIDRWDIQIFATDISREAIERGRAGIYTKLEVERGLPAQYVRKYFTEDKETYRVAPSVHRRVRFQQMNLLDPFPFQNQFDIIFCRNVAIYFEKKVKVDLFRRMLKQMPKHGYLFVGVSESLFDCGPEFKPLYHCKSTFYQPNLLAPAPGTIPPTPTPVAPVAAVRGTVSPLDRPAPSMPRPAAPSPLKPVSAGQPALRRP